MEPSSPALVHDATTGFHDIKAIGSVAPASGFSLEMLCLLAASACLIFVLTRKYLRRPSAKAAVLAPPREAFFKRLAEIRRGGTSPREVRLQALAISAALRSYLEAVIPCPASELTPSELKARLHDILPRTFPMNSPVALFEFNESLYQTLKHLERLSFGTEDLLESGESRMPQLCAEAGQQVSGVDAWLNQNVEPAHAAL